MVEVNDHFHQAETNILEESTLLMGLFRDAAVFPAPHTNKIRLNLLEYAKRVYEDEWVTPVKGGESPKAKEAIQTLWHSYKSLSPHSTKENIWYQLSLKQLNALNQNRVMRLSHGHQSLGSLMWTLLITGAVITVLFLCFFSPESLQVQMSLLSVLAATIAFMLFFILRMDGIYTADMSLPPRELQQVIENFAETIQKGQKI